MVAFAGVIEDHIQDDLDAGVVQASDHGLEFAQVTGRHVALLRREEAEGLVAPIVAQSLIDQEAVVDEGMDRQQLDGGDADRAQVVDDGGGAETGERSALALADVRMAHGVAADMRLVDHRLGPRHPGPGVLAPGERLLDHPAFGHRSGVVAAVERQVGARRSEPEAVMGVGPAHQPRQGPGVGIHQQLVGVEPVALFGGIGAVHPVAVDLPGLDVRQIAVPDAVGVLRQGDPLQLPVTRTVEQAQVDAGGIGREQGEVDAVAVPGRPQGILASGPDSAAQRA